MSEKVKSIQKQIAAGGALQNYKRICTGPDTGYFFFLFYEFIVMMTTSLGGKLGSGLRRLGYSLLCRHVGKNVTIGKECTLRSPQHICLHTGVSIDSNVSLDIKSNGNGITLGRNVRIGRSTIFSCIGDQITIGDESVIGSYCRLGSLKGLIIGRNVRIGNRCYIIGAGHEYSSLDIPIIHQPIVSKGANYIGDNVMIGEGVTILDGVKIGADSIIEPNSLVTRDVSAGSTLAGVPAKVVTVR